MTDQFEDARLEELQLLSEIDRCGEVSFRCDMTGAKHDMIANLVAAKLITDPSMKWQHNESMTFSGLPGESLLERILHQTWTTLLSRVLGHQTVQLAITHKGRIRLSELKQALRSGREREPFGILWDTRHWQQDLQITVLDARENSPVAVPYLDMNGLKQLNDKHGHDAGDLALKTYFQSVASTLADRGHAYRLGGDEVLVVLPNHNLVSAVRIIRAMCNKLMSERPETIHENVSLSIAAGIVISTEPTESPKKLRSDADTVQYKAKEHSKTITPRPSGIAVDGQELIVIENDTGVT